MKATDWLTLAKIAATLAGSPLAGAAIGAAQQLIDYLGRIKQNAQKTGEWTAAERAQVDARWQELMGSKAWRLDTEGG